MLIIFSLLILNIFFCYIGNPVQKTGLSKLVEVQDLHAPSGGDIHMYLYGNNLLSNT